jgi:uncharacterized membrane protein YraQ (UPF0718 family)/copper chaperone CopZ
MFVFEILKETAYLFFEMAPYIMLGLFFVGLLNMFFTKDLIIRHVGKNDFASVFKAAMFGVPLPLCSCGVIPTSVYMARNGASKGSVISFLISTPQTGIDSMIATYGMMGWIFAIFRPVVALITGIVGGLIIRFVDKDNSDAPFKIDNYKNNDSCTDDTCKDNTGADECTDDKCDCGCNSTEKKPKTLIDKLKHFYKYSFIEFLDDISVQFIVGLIISGLISYFIPEKFFENTVVTNGLPGMLLMMAIGVPMYVCATASIPIAITLMMKGFSPGVAFVFLVTGPATNAASLTVLANVLGKKVTVIYVTVIAISAIIFGYLLDWIYSFQSLSNMDMLHSMHHNHQHGMANGQFDWFTLSIGIIFFILIMMSLYRKYIKKLFKKEIQMETGTTFKIDGMTCNHCVMNVNKAITQVNGVTKVDVDLPSGSAKVEGDFSKEAVVKAITDVGYTVVN